VNDHQDDFDDDNEATLLARVPEELLGAMRAPSAEDGSSQAAAIEEETTMRQPDGAVDALLAADADADTGRAGS